eukprot:Gregarina_sp_Pseudo_9__674@NODE_1429_length_1610_cov_448_356461_g1327_i0_p1_GENE_NODE_1429_length_1610_cov_448_356461_g1327_i0NODE_1429_length_1610_cov_448_356461_g1327_i0_p1_ORF_typecomplete_len472_score106_28UDPGT/PF00201_18/7e34Glyco_tran_28_C/PF04101_16/0_001Glyco_transf_28/PF03033_20/0_0039_NODE_1429_length_1610_cov_448_356461_g1327_i0751490
MDSPCVHILITVLPAAGHINPAIQLAHYLVKPAAWKPSTRISVFVYKTPELEDKVQFPEHPYIQYIVRSSGGLYEWVTSMVEKVEEWAQDVIQAVAAAPSRDSDGSAWPAVNAIVYDFMSGFGSVAAEKLQVPAFCFMASPLFCLYALFHLPEITAARRRDPPATSYHIPGIGDFPMGPKPTQAQEALTDQFVKIVEYMSGCYGKAKACLANDVQSFYSTEFLDAFKNQNKIPATWDILCCGPLALGDVRLTASQRDPAVDFMERRAPRSVVFVALGSCWSLPRRSLVELAHGLALSGRPFVFAFRGHEPNDTMRSLLGDDPEPTEPTELDGLPVGFREQVADKGLIVPWANQLQVLNHPALGTFVTHCGWNSSMEALAFGGRPLLLLPIGGDQFGNAVFLSDYLKCGQRMWGLGPDRALDRTKVCEQIEEAFTNDGYATQAQRIKQVLTQEASENGVSETNTMKFFHQIS